MIQGLLGGTIDIASMGASSYAAIYLQAPDAVDPILTYTQSDGASGYYSIMVARKDSGHQDARRRQGQEDRLRRSGFGPPATSFPA